MATIPSFHLYGEKLDEEPRFWIHCETIKSRSSRHRWEIRLHRHERLFQILYIAAGSCDAIVSDETRVLLPPTILTLPPGVSHGFRFSKDVEGLVITIERSQLGEMTRERGRFAQWLSAPHSATLEPEEPDHAYLMDTLQRIAQENWRGDSGDDELLRDYVALAVRLAARIAVGDASAPADGRDERLALLDTLIQQHHREHRPLSFYAGQLGVSLTHLNRLVRTATGQTPHDLITAKLLDQSKRELTFSMATTREIAMRLGFDDPAYFSRFFSKHTGETPGAWRRREKARLNSGAEPRLERAASA